MKKQILSAVPLLLLAFVSGCDSSNDSDGSGGAGGESGSGSVPEVYEFDSRFQDDGKTVSSVSYSGQVFRHLLIEDLKAYIGALEARIDSDASFDPTTVEAGLLSYYEFDSDVQGQESILLSTDPETLQSVYDDVSSGKDLAGKIAGKDSGGAKDHKDWSTEFVGWADATIAAEGGSIDSPDGLVRAFFATLGHQAELHVDGDASRAGLPVYVTPAGQDLQQLIQKFLLGAVTFSQAADDYLDEGLSEDNTDQDPEGNFTALEHAWDEGFGYFGAAQDYLTLDGADLAAGVLTDTNKDDKIDLKSEFSFGASVNAAKRDKGSASGTQFQKEAMTAFLEGRQAISSESTQELEAIAGRAISAWESAIAATAVHYINEVTADIDKVGTADFVFTDYAKHWSELKGFALGFQFNPNSPLSDADFAKLHQLIADGPVLEAAGADALGQYKEDLLEARGLFQAAYSFDDADVAGW